MDKFFIYQGETPVGIVDNADKMTVGQITRQYEELKAAGRTMHLKPIRKGDFDFDPISGQKLIRITKFEYPNFEE